MPAANWSGFYVGVHAGIGGADLNGIFDADGTEPVTYITGMNTSGLLGGVHAGYNWQFGGMIFGLEGDYTWADFEARNRDGENDLQRVSVDYFATIRYRIGATNGNLMTYVTSGIAFSEADLVVENGTGSLSLSAVGIAYGAGIEYRILPGVTIRGEVMRLDFDESEGAQEAGRSAVVDNLPDGDDEDSFGFKGIDIARLGINVQLGGARHATAAPLGPVSNFRGLYIGGTLGYGDVDVAGLFDEEGTDPKADFAAFDLSGLNGGVTVGYNAQFGAILLGLEGDYVWTDSADSFVDGENDRQALSIDEFATIRGRFGVVANRMLVYVTAGAAFADLRLSVENGIDGLTMESVGVAYGGGVEYALMPGVTFKSEYLRLDFNNHIRPSDALPAGAGGLIDQLSDGDDDDHLSFDGIDVFRVGLNVQLEQLFRRAPPSMK